MKTEESEKRRLSKMKIENVGATVEVRGRWERKVYFEENVAFRKNYYILGDASHDYNSYVVFIVDAPVYRRCCRFVCVHYGFKRYNKVHRDYVAS